MHGMKGFYITVKNGLLEAKHVEKISEAIWLFLWLLDKMTIINHETGVGKVLGGKPVKFEEVVADLGISMRTYRRWVKMLEIGGYISTTRTPYGLCFEVFNSFKVFGQRSAKNGTSPDDATVAHQDDKNGTSRDLFGTSNKTIQLDKTIKTVQGTPAQEAKDFFERGVMFVNVVESLCKSAPRNSVEAELNKFIMYWTEPNKSGTRVRWQMQETFDVKRRLYTWLSKTNVQNRPATSKYAAVMV